MIFSRESARNAGRRAFVAAATAPGSWTGPTVTCSTATGPTQIAIVHDGWSAVTRSSGFGFGGTVAVRGEDPEDRC